MIIIWGTRLAGTVDRVPNLFYVRTQYGHLWYIPLIPIKSYIILHGSESGDDFKGLQTSMSGKSVLFGWLRSAAILAGLGGLIGLAINGLAWWKEGHDEHLGLTLFSAAALAGGVLMWWLCEVFSKAGYERAHQLGQELGMPEDLINHFLNGGTLAADDVVDAQPGDVLDAQPADEEKPQ